MTRSDGPGARDRLPAVRILHLVGRSHHRGAELVALELARELERFGHSSSFWAVGPGHEGGTVADLPVLTGAVRQSPLAIALAAARLRRAVGVTDADVILAHGGSALQVAVLKKALDIQAQGALQLIEAASQVIPSNPPHLGNSVDTVA